MKWIRCNHCYCKLEAAQEPFNLTKCGHVFCGRCITQAERQCPICHAVNVPKVCLQEPLDPTVRVFFTPFKDSLQQLLEVFNFQDAQLRITMKKLLETEAKYAYCKNICRKLESGAVKIHKKYKQDIGEYTKLVHNLKDENTKLKLALEKSHNSPNNKYCNSQSSAASLLNLHTCKKRYQQNITKVPFSTPVSVDSKITSNTMSNSEKRYLASLAGSDTIFQIPNITTVPRSVGTRSFASTASTSTGVNPERMTLNSLMISRS